jgi:predicted O-methyltransferase YrrM
MENTSKNIPETIQSILDKTISIGFEQLSDPLLGQLLSTLSATKPGGRFIELGTGSGLATAWMLQGMDEHSTLETVDNDETLLSIAKHYLGKDPRVKFILGDGEDLILNTQPATIDFIFADAWPGKYHLLETTLSLLKPGGVYLIDDMLFRDSWPDGHAEKANHLIHQLESRNDLHLTKMIWSSGIIICSKRA